MNDLLHLTLMAGAYFVSFGLLCGLPARYVRRRVAAAMSPVACASAGAAAALAGSVPAYLLTATLIHGSHWPVPFGSMTLIGALAGMAADTVIGKLPRHV